MAQRDKADISRALLKKGFYRKNKDHEFYYYEGYEFISTKLSYGGKIKTYGDDLLGKIKRQLKLSNSKELLDFIDCPLTGNDYREILEKKDIIKKKE